MLDLCLKFLYQWARLQRFSGTTSYACSACLESSEYVTVIFNDLLPRNFENSMRLICRAWINLQLKQNHFFESKLLRREIGKILYQSTPFRSQREGESCKFVLENRYHTFTAEEIYNWNTCMIPDQFYVGMDVDKPEMALVCNEIFSHFNRSTEANKLKVYRPKLFPVCLGRPQNHNDWPSVLAKRWKDCHWKRIDGSRQSKVFCTGNGDRWVSFCIVNE